MRNKKFNRRISCITAALTISFILPFNKNVYADNFILRERNISNGISFAEKQFINETSSGSKLLQRVNVVTADLKNENVDMIFGRAKDKSLGLDNVSKQIEQETKKGNKVVAGMNADFFNMNNGASVGPQIENGGIIVGYTSKSDEKKYPILVVDEDNNTSIEKLSFSGDIKIIDSPNIGSDVPDWLLEELESTALPLAVDSVNRYSEFEWNKYRVNNKMMVLTPNYSINRKVEPSNFAPGDVFVVVEGMDKPKSSFVNGGLKLDTKYLGKVTQVLKGKSVVIPENGVVLALNGSKADFALKNIKQGNIISLQVAFNKKKIKNAIAGQSYLVNDSKALTKQQIIDNGITPGFVNSRRSRTAIGLNSKNEVVAIILEGGNKTADKSSGATLDELAKTMEELGAVTAMNLDGGGSTQMNVKKYGDNDREIINSPEDGRERSVANTILFVNKGLKTDKVGSMKLENPFLIYKNSTHKLEIRGEDVNAYPIDLNGKQINWSVDDKSASITENGIFSAGDDAVLVKITAECDGVKESTYAIVVDDLGTLESNVGRKLNMMKNDKFQFKISGRALNGQKINLDSKAVKWSVTGNIGTIDKNGLFTAEVSKGNGFIVGEIGNRKIEVFVQIGNAAVNIEDFEEVGDVTYTVNGFVGGKGEISKDIVYNGKQSLKVTYDYSNWAKKYNGTINVVPKGNEEPFISYTRPDMISVMVYGDGKAPWLRGKMTDGNGEEFTVDFTKNIDWKGSWKNVYAKVPEDVALPVKLNYIYMVETDKKANKSGTVYFDDLKFIYGDKVGK